MRTILGLLCAMVVVLGMVGNVGAALVGDPWLDQVIYWNDVSPLNTGSHYPERVLGPNDNYNVSISTGDELIVAFIDNYAFDGDGNDLYITEHIGTTATVYVYASFDNVQYTYLGNALSDEWYDLNDYDGLDLVKYLKFIGNCNEGSSPGYDLDAVEAINSAAVSIPSAVWLLGTGLIGLVGCRRKFKK